MCYSTIEYVSSAHHIIIVENAVVEDSCLLRVVGGYYIPFALHYAFSVHPPLQLHPTVPRPWALDMYSTVSNMQLQEGGWYFDIHVHI